jgi:hypothetical protein
MRFRERHQDPKSTDIEYAARINNLDGIDGFIKAHSGAPWFVSMVGFVAGLPFLYQMVDKSRQIEVPKYLRPRTDTPKLTVGHGGCFGCIYSVRGAGGYQMFGITPMPIYDPNQKISYLRDFMCLFKPGDIVKWKPIDREAYDQAVADVEAGRSRRHAQRHFLARRLQPRHRRLQSQARGAAPWPLRSGHRASQPPSRISAGPAIYHIGIPLSGGMDRYALTCANLLVGNEEGAAVLEAVFMGPELEFTDDATVAVTGAELAAQGRWRAAGDLDILQGQEGPESIVRFLEEGGARLYRNIGRHRRAGGARQPLDLRIGRAWRLQGPQARSGR